MFIIWMVHVNSIKINIHIVLGDPPQILAIFSNIVPWFIDVPGLKVWKYLIIKIVGVPYFSVNEVLGVYTPPPYQSLDCCKDIYF